VTANVQLADVAPTMLSFLGVDIPAWMDGGSLLPVAAQSPNRPIFGVSDMKPRVGPSGLRLLRDGGAPNYGVSSVMMVAGNQWFEASLISGEMESGPVNGHTDTDAAPVSEPEARALLLERIRSVGFEFERHERQATAAQPPGR
jgi:hypothetical protein